MDKKSLQYLGVIIIIAIIVCIGFFYLSLMSKIEMEEKISEHREYIYQNKVTSESSSETCWINDEGKKECTATFGKRQWINDEGVFKNFTDVVDMSFNKSSGDLIYSYKKDYSVVARLFLVVDVSQSICEAQGWDWRSQDDACFLWWSQAKEFMEAKECNKLKKNKSWRYLITQKNQSNQLKRWSILHLVAVSITFYKELILVEMLGYLYNIVCLLY